MTTDHATRDTVGFDPFDPQFYADMHHRLALLRSHEPVHFISQLRTWCATTYPDCELLFHDPRFVKRGWTQMVVSSFGSDGTVGDFLFFKDPPDHTRLRRLVQKNFRYKTVAALAGRSVEVADQLVAGLRRDGGGDLVKDFGWKIPIPVIGSLLDVPADDSDMIGKWGRDLFLSGDMTRPDMLPAGRQAFAEMYAYMTDHVNRTRTSDGFIASLAATAIDGDQLSEHELVIMCLQVLIGGYDTTAHQIASGAYLLLSNPEQLRHLRADWSLIDNTVEEILRCEPATPFLGREAAVDVVLGGKTIHAGDLIGPLVAAANRDPDRYTDPDRFDITTSRPPHLTFGLGIRRCLGEHLARLTLKTAITRLFDSGLTLTLEEQQPRWRPSLLFRGLEALPARVL